MIMKKLIGAVTEEEKLEIQVLFERRNGLNELARIVTGSNEMLYEKLVKDLGETGGNFRIGGIVCQININGNSVRKVIGRLILARMRFIWFTKNDWFE